MRQFLTSTEIAVFACQSGDAYVARGPMADIATAYADAKAALPYPEDLVEVLRIDREDRRVEDVTDDLIAYVRWSPAWATWVYEAGYGEPECPAFALEAVEEAAAADEYTDLRSAGLSHDAIMGL